MKKEFMTTAELGTYLRVSRSTIYRYVKLGLPVVKLGIRNNKYSLNEVLKWFEATYNTNPHTK